VSAGVAHAPRANDMVMSSGVQAQRCRQFCSRCGQLMFEYFRSPDGHFGLANAPPTDTAAIRTGRDDEISCPLCGARYRLLERTNAMGQAVERK